VSTPADGTTQDEDSPERERMRQMSAYVMGKSVFQIFNETILPSTNIKPSFLEKMVRKFLKDGRAATINLTETENGSHGHLFTLPTSLSTTISNTIGTSMAASSLSGAGVSAGNSYTHYGPPLAPTSRLSSPPAESNGNGTLFKRRMPTNHSSSSKRETHSMAASNGSSPNGNSYNFGSTGSLSSTATAVAGTSTAGGGGSSVPRWEEDVGRKKKILASTWTPLKDEKGRSIFVLVTITRLWTLT
jgi:hypothetical protein